MARRKTSAKTKSTPSPKNEGGESISEIRTARPVHVDTLFNYIRECKLPLMSSDETIEMISRIQQGDPQETELRRMIVLRNIRLVYVYARRYLGRGLSFQDLVQEGIIGINIAINKFQEAKQTTFSTYAVYWIRQGMTRAIADHGRTIRIPVHRLDAARSLIGIRQSLKLQRGGDPTIYDVYCEANRRIDEKNEERAQENKPLVEHYSLFEVRIGLTVLRNSETNSLDSSLAMDPDGIKTLHDVVPDGGRLSPEDIAHVQSLYDQLNLLFLNIHQIIQRLPQREADILFHRLRLNGKNSMTLQQLGEAWNLSRERIRQLENKALKCLTRHTDLSAEELSYLLSAREELERELAS